jgi:hypothetical protein
MPLVHAAEIFRGRRYIQIEDAAELVVIHLGGRFDGSQFHDGVQWGRIFEIRATKGYLLQVTE